MKPKNPLSYYHTRVFGQPLTKSEVVVKDLLLAGLSNQEIAKILCVHIKTIKGHLTFIYKKLGVKNRVGLILLEYSKKTTAKRVTEAVVKINQETFLPKGK